MVTTALQKAKSIKGAKVYGWCIDVYMWCRTKPVLHFSLQNLQLVRKLLAKTFKPEDTPVGQDCIPIKQHTPKSSTACRPAYLLGPFTSCFFISVSYLSVFCFFFSLWIICKVRQGLGADPLNLPWIPWDEGMNGELEPQSKQAECFFFPQIYNRPAPLKSQGAHLALHPRGGGSAAEAAADGEASL